MNDRCPFCDRGPGEYCVLGCVAEYRQQAGQTHHDGADYIRNFWAKLGAPLEPVGPRPTLDSLIVKGVES